MLKTRVITALALMALLLPSLFFLPPLGWALLVAVFIGIGGWEWGALLGWNANRRKLFGALLAVACASVALVSPATMGASRVAEGLAPAWVLATYGLAALFWIVVVPAWFSRRWKLPGGLPGILVGLLVLFPAWLAMVQLRVAGPGVLLAIMAVVWMADVAAYFSGKAFGRHKLAPSISPGKTVEGACGAAIGVVIYGLVLRVAFAFEPVALPLWILALLAVTLVSIAGDLFESLLKRQAGLKDSSNILPGHGGILDRIDSLTSTLPVVALAWLLLGAHT